MPSLFVYISPNKYKLMKTILITGGSGLIGRKLSDLFIEKGYIVIWLSRERFLETKFPRYRWDYQNGEIDLEAVEQADIIIHLAGCNLGDGYWTKVRKRRIVESRVMTSRLLLDSMKKINKKPDLFVSSSAIGYYGMHTDNKIYNENDLPARNDFLSQTCKKWEEAAFCFKQEEDIRTVVLRTSFVISSQSPALKKIMLPVRFGFGAPIGSGKQYFSWIHLEDLCELYIKAVEDDTMEGVYNAVSPDQITNFEFMSILSKVMNSPFIMPKIPAFLIRIFMGEAAGMILEGSQVSSQKAIDIGFKFKYDSISKAIEESIKR